MRYNLNGKNINIPDADIERSMKSLELTKEEAIQMWLEDEGYLENEKSSAPTFHYVLEDVITIEKDVTTTDKGILASGSPTNSLALIAAITLGPIPVFASPISS